MSNKVNIPTLQIKITHCPETGRPKGLTLTVTWNLAYSGILQIPAKVGMQAHRLALVSFAFMLKLFTTQLEKEIKEFVEYKAGISTTSASNHWYHLRVFKRHSQVDSCQEIKIEHIQAYAQYISDNHTPFTLMKHMETMRGFIRYFRHPYIRPDWINAFGVDEERLAKDLKSFTIKDMTRKSGPGTQKIERNRELVLKRKKDPVKWSFSKLGDHYGMTKRAVWEIWERDKSVY